MHCDGKTANDFLSVLPRSTAHRGPRESLTNQIKQPRVSDRGLDSVVAIETSGDLGFVVTPAYPAFALPVKYACAGC
jgi:hypothetical protein